MDNKKIEKIAGDVEVIKRFMVIDLISRGYSQDDVGKLLGVSQATVSEMFPGGILKKAKSLAKA